MEKIISQMMVKMTTQRCGMLYQKRLTIVLGQLQRDKRNNAWVHVYFNQVPKQKRDVGKMAGKMITGLEGLETWNWVVKNNVDPIQINYPIQ